MTISKYLSMLAICLLHGCASNYYLDTSRVGQHEHTYPEVISFQQPSDKVTEKILKESGVYTVAPESSSTIQHLKIERVLACGNPLIASVLFLGLVPVTLPDSMYVTYTLKTPDRSQMYSHEIELTKQVSVWEWLAKPFTKSEEGLLIEGLKYVPRRAVNCADRLCSDFNAR